MTSSQWLRVLASIVFVFVLCSRQSSAQQSPGNSQFAPSTYNQQTAQPNRGGDFRPNATGGNAPARNYPSTNPATNAPGYPQTYPQPAATNPGQQGDERIRTAALPEQRPISANQTSEGTASPAIQSPANLAPAKPVSAAPAWGIKEVNAAIERLQSDTTLDDEKKKAEVALLEEAAKWLEQEEKLLNETKQLNLEIDSAPQLLELAKQALAEPLPTLPTRVSDNTQMVELEAQLAKLQEQLTTFQQELSSNNTDSGVKDDAVSKERRARVKATIKKVEGELATTEANPEARGAIIKAKAHLRTVNAELAYFEARDAHDTALGQTKKLQHDVTQRKVNHWQKQIALWKDLIASHRKRESQRQADEARRQVESAHPALKELAERNVTLAETRTNLAEQLAQSNTDLETLNKQLSSLQEDFADVKGKLETSGMTPAIGLLLRSRRDEMPSLAKHREVMHHSTEEFQRAQLALLELKAERTPFADPTLKSESILASLSGVEKQFAPNVLASMVDELVAKRREYLDALIADFEAYRANMTELESQTSIYVGEIQVYSSYIDERVLWIRSADLLSKKDLDESKQALASICNIGAAQRLGKAISNHATSRPWAVALGLTGIVLLFSFRRRMREKIAEIGAELTDEHFGPTVIVCALTLGIALLYPMIAFGVGWWIDLGRGESKLAQDIGVALQTSAFVMLIGTVLREVVSKDGLSRKHFDMNNELADSMRGAVNRCFLLATPLVFVVTVFETHQDGAYRDSLGRIAFVFGMFAMIVFAHRNLRPHNSLLASFLDRFENRWPTKLKPVWYILGITGPLGLCGLAIFGYYYSVHELVRHANELMWFSILLAFSYAIVKRAIVTRCLHLSRLEAADTVPADVSSEVRADDSEEIMLEGAPQAVSPEKLQEERTAAMNEVAQQLKQLLAWTCLIVFLVGACVIWAEMVPALQVLNRVELWSKTITVVETVKNAEGVEKLVETTQRAPVTLAHLLLSLLTVSIAVMAVRRLPGLLQVTVLDRLPLDVGLKYAIAIMARYTLAVVGLVVAASLIRVDWTSVQWLAAAMTVGLGFGMQEIFANFVSGLIILFERPIRIGDLVTVSGITGKVSKMQIRATTITDFDRRELIVPNKKFITDDVVNWTLSDPITRFTIPVGISYSCDPALAQKVLLKLAQDHPLVLNEPAPSAVFVGFGSSTLDLQLRAFLGKRDQYPEVIHALNVAIAKAFEENELEIAFPQQDLHIRSVVSKEEQAGQEKKAA